MELRIAAPNRIDLGGGTTDLYPLYLFMEGGCTVNAAISVRSTVTFKTCRASGVRIFSEDLEKSVEAVGSDHLPLDGPLGLISRAVRMFPPESGLEIVTCNQAPAGSGLGASSALLVALIQGLQYLRSEREEPESVVKLAVNIEAASIGVPAGSQDHIASVYGGVSVLEFGHREFSRRSLPDDSDFTDTLEQSLVLSFTGENRFSGMNNWEITKGFIDGKNGIRDKLIKIRDIARSMAEGLISGNWEVVGKLIDEEWQVRRTLADMVSTPRIEAIMLAASEAGALANKICGAGGGGCMITFVEPGKRSEVEKAIVNAGGTLMPFTIDRQGVRIEYEG
jgi:D-glycero-alpha-D-manno-heptose-7-phosphate kinase